MSTIRRDYRELVPLLRHRYEPEHPAAVALRRAPRDVRLTIDAALQLARRGDRRGAREGGIGRAAAVVLDPDSGAVLASVSYPWPSDGALTADEGERRGRSLLDRARYGLYPPGSTFKLVTAAAALDRDVELAADGVHLQPAARRTSRREAARLEPSGPRRCAGYASARNDRHARRAGAFVQRLLRAAGVEDGAEAAGRLRGAARHRADAVESRRRRACATRCRKPAYGQADVRATPLRMARVAAAIAASGVLRDARWEQTAAAGGEPFCRRRPRGCCGDMRDVVTERHRPQSAPRTRGASRGRPAPRRSTARRRTAGSSDSRRTARRRGGSRLRS